MVVVDRLSKDLIYEAINDLTPEGVAKTFLRAVFPHWGLPYSTISDRGAQFVNHFWNQLCKRLDIDVKLSTAFHPETDGQTENANGVMEQYLRAFCAYLQDDWCRWLPTANFAARNHYSRSIGCSPFYANHGWHPRMGIEPPRDPEDGLPRTARERRQRLNADFNAERMNEIYQELRGQMAYAQAFQEEYANRHRAHAPKRHIGDKVWLDTRNLTTRRPAKKLSNKNEGPFEIIQVVSPHAYRLRLPDTWKCHDVFATNLIGSSSSVNVNLSFSFLFYV